MKKIIAGLLMVLASNCYSAVNPTPYSMTYSTSQVRAIMKIVGEIRIGSSTSTYNVLISSHTTYFGNSFKPYASSRFNIGEVYVSSTTFPAFSGYTDFFRSSATITGVRAYAELTSTDTASQVQFDIVYSSSTNGASSSRTWASIFTSTVPWLSANSIYSNTFVPNVSAMKPNWSISPRIISIPTGTLPQIIIEVIYKRRVDE